MREGYNIQFSKTGAGRTLPTFLAFRSPSRNIAPESENHFLVLYRVRRLTSIGKF